MKRFIQFAAFIAVALLAAQPALAGLPCEMGTSASGHCAPCCHKAMSRMGMDCPMHHQVTASGCGQSCCHDALPLGVAELAAGVKPKAGRTDFFAVAPQIASEANAPFVAAPPGNTCARAPARYILFQVFRI